MTGINKSEDELREKLAALCHEQWSHWMKYMFSKCRTNNGVYVSADGRYDAIIPGRLVDRWRRQLNTSYEKLLEEEKESDRKEADKFLELLEEHFTEFMSDFTVPKTLPPSSMEWVGKCEVTGPITNVKKTLTDE